MPISKNRRRWFAATLLAVLSVPAAAVGETALRTQSGPVELAVVHHASFVMTWNGRTIYVDPVGPADRYADTGPADLVLITHAHGDHLSRDTLNALDTRQATLVMPPSVAAKLDRDYGEARRVMANGDRAEIAGIGIRAVPMYNLPPGPDTYHPKGKGNGYVLTLRDKRVYISGDTEGTPPMRALENIDMAFVCMNLPYTMAVPQAADAVTDFAPDIVYPYHYRGQDIQRFKRLVNDAKPAIDVRLRDWYD